MKDRLLDLLSREEEEESHGEDVVSYPTMDALLKPSTTMTIFPDPTFAIQTIARYFEL